MTTWIRRFSLMTMVMMLGVILVGCGGVKDKTIPTPPNGSELKQGDDATVDMLMPALDSAMKQSAAENKITVDKQTFFKSSDNVATVQSFYQKEMKDRGWGNEKTQSDPNGIVVMAFQTGSDGAIIMLMDAGMMGSGTGTIVYAMNGTEQ